MSSGVFSVLLVVHTILVIFLIILILLQRSESDGMGLSGGGNQFLSGRAQANILTRTTAILAGLFLLSSLVLAMLGGHMGRSSIVDTIPAEAPASADAPAAPAEDAPVPALMVPKAE